MTGCKKDCESDWKEKSQSTRSRRLHIGILLYMIKRASKQFFCLEIWLLKNDEMQWCEELHGVGITFCKAYIYYIFNLLITGFRRGKWYQVVKNKMHASKTKPPGHIKFLMVLEIRVKKAYVNIRHVTRYLSNVYSWWRYETENAFKIVIFNDKYRKY